ncbi:hypothetical protein RRF57_005141 [Xylaria bambusicola]|uniref:Uncharacterized protein n=1 Tax=Xylaria bambusicola TaxID=326684 RepID=A0AAN7UBV9_9PEZI
MFRLNDLRYLPHGEDRGGYAANNVSTRPLHNNNWSANAENSSLAWLPRMSKSVWTGPLAETVNLYFDARKRMPQPAQTCSRCVGPRHQKLSLVAFVLWGVGGEVAQASPVVVYVEKTREG